MKAPERPETRLLNDVFRVCAIAREPERALVERVQVDEGHLLEFAHLLVRPVPANQTVLLALLVP